MQFEFILAYLRLNNIKNSPMVCFLSRSLSMNPFL
jgi:hypothetical protein